MPQLPRPCQRFSNGFEPIHLIKSEQLHTSRGLAERVVNLQQPGSASALVNPTERPDTESAPTPTDPLPGPEVPVDVSVEGGSPENPVVMTYSELKETLRGDDPWPAVEVLRDKWVQITGPPTAAGAGVASCPTLKPWSIPSR